MERRVSLETIPRCGGRAAGVFDLQFQSQDWLALVGFVLFFARKEPGWVDAENRLKGAI